MTNRLDRMEAAGLIRRLPDPNDRRGTLVEPTEEGHAGLGQDRRRVRRGARLQLRGVLSESDKERLHDLLRDLMLAFPDWKQKKHAQPVADTDD